MTGIGGSSSGAGNSGLEVPIGEEEECRCEDVRRMAGDLGGVTLPAPGRLLRETLF